MSYSENESYTRVTVERVRVYALGYIAIRDARVAKEREELIKNFKQPWRTLMQRFKGLPASVLGREAIIEELKNTYPDDGMGSSCWNESLISGGAWVSRAYKILELVKACEDGYIQISLTDTFIFKRDPEPQD